MATYKDGYPLLPGPLSHTPPLFHKLQLGKLVFESTNGIGPSNNVLKCIRVSETHCHNTRYADEGNLYINSVRTTRFGLKGLQFEGAKLWTAISTKIAKLRSHSKFDPQELPECYKQTVNYIVVYSIVVYFKCLPKIINIYPILEDILYFKNHRCCRRTTFSDNSLL